MKLFLATVALISLTLTGCDEHRIKGSGVVSTETRKVDDFHSISLRGPFDIDYTDGPAQDLIVEADDNFLPLIITEVKDGQLIVRLKPHTAVSSHKTMKVTVTAPDVEELSLAGSGTIHVLNDWQSDNPLKVSLAGSGDIIGSVSSPGIKASIAGAGNIKLKGETKDVDVVIAGSGNYYGDNLRAENAEVSISGSGNADVHASVNLKVKIAGSGDVNYKGSPQVDSHISGSGSVHKKD